MQKSILMKFYQVLMVLLLICSACVPSKKYKELLSKEKTCAEELAKYKKSSLENESKAKELQIALEMLIKENAKLKKDTAVLGQDFRIASSDLASTKQQLEEIQKTYDRYKSLGTKETNALQKQLEAKTIELQNKSEALVQLEAELKIKQKLLEEREQRVNELEDMLKKQDDVLKALRKKVADALVGFENKGLKVEQKNGKIYVSMEAKLLFKSGSIVVEAEGKSALLQIGKALENETELEIVVEGHTDTDKLNGSTFPHDNWELSVLRATSVVEIILANSKLNPKKIVAAGRSEYLPVDENDKAKNRRIEIIISPDLDALFEIISNN